VARKVTAGLFVHVDVGEIEMPLAWPHAAVGKDDADGSRARARQLAAFERLAQGDEIRARLLDVDPDRVEPLDLGHGVGLVGGDKGALGHAGLADPPADGGKDPGIAKVDRRSGQGCPGCRDLRTRLVVRCLCVGGVLFANPARGDERAEAFSLSLLLSTTACALARAACA
jgi:hypothetical protein